MRKLSDTTAVSTSTSSRTLHALVYSLIIATAVAVGLFGASTSAQAAVGAAPAPGLVSTTMLTQQTKVDAEVLRLINVARAKVGAPALQAARGATKVAHTWSSHMASNLKRIEHN